MSIGQSEEIQVSAYAGYRGYEIPRSFIIDGTQYTIQTILDRSLKQDLATGKRFYSFKVLTEDNLEFVLIFSISSLKWYRVVQSD